MPDTSSAGEGGEGRLGHSRPVSSLCIAVVIWSVTMTKSTGLLAMPYILYIYICGHMLSRTDVMYSFIYLLSCLY